ncbi:hypothetical protein ACROYT_G024043, partial [Oculina patagonica]
MNDTQEQLSQLALELKQREHWLVGIESTVYLAVILTALLGNIVLFPAVYKINTIRSRQNFYLLSLAATDILNAVVCMPLTLLVLIQGTWPFGDFICQLQGSLISISATVSLLTLGTIAINRYVKIVRSASLYQKIFSKRNILISIAITWIATTFLMLSTFSFRKTVFHFHPGKCMCWLQINLKDRVGLYGQCLYAITVSITFTAIMFSYCKVFRKVRAHFAQVANSSIHNDSSVAFAEEVKITTMLFATILAFLICWVPSVIIDFYEMITGYYTLPRQVYFLNIFTFASSSAVNPLIYGLMKREFKEAYKKVVCCRD